MMNGLGTFRGQGAEGTYLSFLFRFHTSRAREPAFCFCATFIAGSDVITYMDVKYEISVEFMVVF